LSSWGNPFDFSPNGGSLAVARRGQTEEFRAGNWSDTRPVSSKVLWLDSQSGSVRREFEIPNSDVRSLTFSPDGQTLAVATLQQQPPQGIIRLFNLRQRREIQTIESPCPYVEALTFTPDGERIAAGMGDTSIVLWDVRPSDERR
jgi:hypothetical protein